MRINITETNSAVINLNAYEDTQYPFALVISQNAQKEPIGVNLSIGLSKLQLAKLQQQIADAMLTYVLDN